MEKRASIFINVFCVCVLFLFVQEKLFCGSPAKPDTTSVAVWDTLWQDTKIIVNDGVSIFTAPLRFGLSEWLIVSGVVATDAALMLTLDEKTRTKFKEGHNETKDNLNNIGNYFGNTIPNIAVSGTLYLSGLVVNSNKIRVAGLHVFQATLYSGLINIALKGLLGRERPYGNEGAFIFTPFTADNRYNSHPSGHSTMAFSLASVLSYEIDNPIATSILYSAATLTAMSRIYSDMHWLSDTFLGASLGTICGYAVCRLHEQNITNPTKQSSLRFYPTINGIGLSMNF